MAKEKKALFVVNSVETLNEALSKYRAVEARLNAEDASLSADIAQITSERSKVMENDKKEKEYLAQIIEDYCTENKATLFTGDKKTLKLTNGTVSFKKKSDKIVEQLGVTIDGVIERIKKSKFGLLLLREKKELNKNALNEAVFNTKQISVTELSALGLKIEEGKEEFSFKLTEIKG